MLDELRQEVGARVLLWLAKPNATVSASFLCGELAAATVGYPAFLL